LPEGAAVACTGVVKRYRTASGAVEALDGVDAAFAPASLGALVGPSGCGKSTLLRLLGGLDGPDGGSIAVGAVEVESLRGRALRRYRREVVTYVAQRAASNLVPHLTVREHLLPGTDTALLDRLGIGDRLDRRAGRLSGGEQARAALGLALLRDTPLLLVDEPTAELDRDAAAHVLEALAGAAAAGRTVIVATHDPELVAAADAAVHLEGVEPAARHGGSPRAPGAPVLRVDGLAKAYGATRAVDGASLDLAAGELGVLLGRSGSGKSTLLMMLGGWLPADAGRVEIAGVAGGATPGWAAVGYLAQRFGLLPELSVAENVALPFRLAGLPDEGRVELLLDRLGLSALAGRYPAETSVGQQQRVALARALALRPSLLLADEPSSHQDAGFAGRTWDVLLEARDEGTACLVATHDPAAAERADRVWEIADGRLV
jgi:putative ABC transport system ATP-binding protein